MVESAMEADQASFKMVDHQQEIVAPVLGEPGEISSFETAHHNAGPSIDLLVQGDEGWAQRAKLGGVGDASEGHVGVAGQDAPDLGAGFGPQRFHPRLLMGP